MSYDSVPNGELAAVVTYLEILERPPVEAADFRLKLRRIEHPDVDWYRDLFRAVGAPWLWFSRLTMDDAQLATIIQDPDVELFSVEDGSGRAVGMVELDFRAPGECELAFIGLIPDLAGKGHGKGLLAATLERAWKDGVARVHVHTCSLDHPAALPAYLRAGFFAYKRAVERFPDPRLSGILPIDCAPRIPLIGTLS